MVIITSKHPKNNSKSHLNIIFLYFYNIPKVYRYALFSYMYLTLVKFAKLYARK